MNAGLKPPATQQLYCRCNPPSPSSGDEMFPSPTPTPPSPTPTSSGTCTNGIPGIQSKNTCCLLACGICGGSGCGSRNGLTGNECCEGNIVAQNVFCTESGAAPCIVGGFKSLGGLRIEVENNFGLFMSQFNNRESHQTGC